MKKIFILFLTAIISISAYSQNYKDNDYYYYDGVENYQGFTITREQKNKIISIKKNIGRRHAAIGKNSSLRGQAKGEAHRKLNQQIRKEIYDILDSSQRVKWDDYRSKSWTDENNSMERKLDAIENKIDDLEDYYDDLIDKVEDDKRLSKAERKERKNSLKKEFKAKKAVLEKEKEVLKNSRY